MTSPGSVPTEELAKADVIDWTKGDAARWKVDIVKELRRWAGMRRDSYGR